MPTPQHQQVAEFVESMFPTNRLTLWEMLKKITMKKIKVGSIIKMETEFVKVYRVFQNERHYMVHPVKKIEKTDEIVEILEIEDKSCTIHLRYTTSPD